MRDDTDIERTASSPGRFRPGSLVRTRGCPLAPEVDGESDEYHESDALAATASNARPSFTDD